MNRPAMTPCRKELALPELLQITIENLSDSAAYLRVMSLGRSESEMITLHRAAEKISKLGTSLGRLVRAGRWDRLKKIGNRQPCHGAGPRY
jgi:hypothetical protein